LGGYGLIHAHDKYRLINTRLSPIDNGDDQINLQEKEGIQVGTNSGEVMDSNLGRNNNALSSIEEGQYKEEGSSRETEIETTTNEKSTSDNNSENGIKETIEGEILDGTRIDNRQYLSNWNR
jgi:hypothetical protein